MIILNNDKDKMIISNDNNWSWGKVAKCASRAMRVLIGISERIRRGKTVDIQ